MALKLSKTLRGRGEASHAEPTIFEYERAFRLAKSGAPESEGDPHYLRVNNLYYDAITDFYEFGWGRSFHFAPRIPGESFKESLARHERFLADALALKPGMVVADIGSGVAGPMLEIARHSGAKIVGVNSNAMQNERARRYMEAAGLAHLAEFLQCDFLHVDAPDNTFDAAYAIETTCCTPDKVGIYGEIFRLLKPGAAFGAYEYCLTERFDPHNPHHLQLKADIEFGGGLPEIDTRETVDDALREVGFEVLRTKDLAVQSGPSIPWYQPLLGSGPSFASFRSSMIGRWVTHNSLRALEALRIAPRGARRAAEILNLCGTAMPEAGRLGIFTPMYFLHARKPK